MNELDKSQAATTFRYILYILEQALRKIFGLLIPSNLTSAALIDLLINNTDQQRKILSWCVRCFNGLYLI